MFDHFVWSVVVVPPLVVVLVRLLADRLRPGPAARVIAWSAAAAAFASTVNLLLFAVKAVAEVPAVGRAFGWSAGVVAEDAVHEPWVSWVAVVLLTAVTVSVALRWRRHHAVLEAAGGGGDGLVMLADPSAQAFAVPGRPGYVVVTTGMRRLLTDRQFDALLAHERAHLAGRHHRLIRLAELAAAAHPALWWVARHVDYLVERAADEQAVTAVGSRVTVAHAIGVAALATSGGGAGAGHLHAARSAGVVPRRVAHLLQPRGGAWPRRLRFLPAVLAVPALTSLIWTAEATRDLVELLQAARGR